MNTNPPSQHEALSQEELELARVVRALPGGGPPPALDALILKAASDAVASAQPSKKSLWSKGLLGTSALWLGTAAASVLTVGIGWQVFQSMRAPIYELPADENISTAQEIDQSHKDDSLIVEMAPPREPAPTSPPPPEPFAEADKASAVAAAPMAPAEKPAAMLPEKRERQELARQQIANQMAADALAKKTDDGSAEMRRDQAAAAADLALQASEVAAPAAAPAPPPPMPVGAIAPAVSGSAKGLENKEIYTVTAPATRIRRAEEESNAPAQSRSFGYGKAKLNTAADEDSKLSPELWLYAIRDRVKRDDIEGAKASIRLFQETFPTRRIPEDLKPLLK